jgi:hypothetical protein
MLIFNPNYPQIFVDFNILRGRKCRIMIFYILTAFSHKVNFCALYGLKISE